MKTRILILALALVLALGAAAGTLALGGVERARWVLGGGASDFAAGDAALRATLGQPVVGMVASGGGAVTLGQGFWSGASAAGYAVYLPLLIRD